MIRTAATAVLVLSLLAAPAFTQGVTASVRDARVTAKDKASVQAASKFYQAVFGAKEIVVIDRATATGTSFTAIMLIDTVATTESTVPSFTLKVNESFPLTFAFGVEVRFGTVPLSTPFVGCPSTV